MEVTLSKDDGYHRKDELFKQLGPALIAYKQNEAVT